MNTSPLPVPNSVLFQAPGRPLAAAEQLAARERVVAAIEARAAGLRYATTATTGRLHLTGPGTNLSQLGDHLEEVVKSAAGCLDADLIGGASVTRLDWSLSLNHARLPYRKALRIANSRGWSLALGEELPLAAQATLVRFCGLLPVQILCPAGQPRPASLEGTAAALLYVLPLAGAALEAQAGEDASHCAVDLDRLLQFLLGLTAT